MTKLSETDQEQYDLIQQFVFVDNSHIVNSEYSFTAEKFLELKKAFENMRQVVEFNDITGNTEMTTSVDSFMFGFVLTDKVFYVKEVGIIIFSIPDSAIVQSLSDPEDYKFFNLLMDMFSDRQFPLIRLVLKNRIK